MECTCGNVAENTEIKIKVFDIVIGKYPGYKCSECGEEWIDDEIAGRIERDTKELKWFGPKRN
jgi:YgiT-type zinc finger domain-containing protein